MFVFVRFLIDLIRLNNILLFLEQIEIVLGLNAWERFLEISFIENTELLIIFHTKIFLTMA